LLDLDLVEDRADDDGGDQGEQDQQQRVGAFPARIGAAFIFGHVGHSNGPTAWQPVNSSPARQRAHAPGRPPHVRLLILNPPHRAASEHARARWHRLHPTLINSSRRWAKQVFRRLFAICRPGIFFAAGGATVVESASGPASRVRATIVPRMRYPGTSARSRRACGHV
jgi:hypothetical protein